MMNWVDILILVILCIAGFSSLRTGFVRQTFAILGFVVGVYAALSRHERLATTLSEWISQPTLAKAVAFVLILVAVWVLSAIVASLARQALNATGLAWIDSFFGLLMGLAIGLFVVVCTLMLLVRIPLTSISSSVEKSSLSSYIFQLLPHLTQLLPSEMRIFEAL
jgi:membrane protein required for colicin V production